MVIPQIPVSQFRREQANSHLPYSHIRVPRLRRRLPVQERPRRISLASRRPNAPVLVPISAERAATCPILERRLRGPSAEATAGSSVPFASSPLPTVAWLQETAIESVQAAHGTPEPTGPTRPGGPLARAPRWRRTKPSSMPAQAEPSRSQLLPRSPASI